MVRLAWCPCKTFQQLFAGQQPQQSHQSRFASLSSERFRFYGCAPRGICSRSALAVIYVSDVDVVVALDTTKYS